MPVSCGVMVTDGARLLLGHATRTTRWDIPKGMAEPGEDHAAAARRELREETGLQAEALADLGLHRYLPGKDLALFAWMRGKMPDPASLTCTSMVVPPRGAAFPEMDRFGVFTWAEVAGLVTPNLLRVLNEGRTRLV